MSGVERVGETEWPRYPARLDIEYPEGGLGRASTFFRIILALPIAVIVGLLGNNFAGTWEFEWAQWVFNTAGGLAILSALWSGGVLVLPTLLMILFRLKYPRWWFDWHLELMRFTTRVGAYVSLMRDEYPSTDEEQAVRLDLDYPDASRDLNRWMPLVKWLLAIPHYIALFALGLASLVCVVIAWFAILFTGRYPRGLFDFVLGVQRWSLRVSAYMWLLTTDRYPPFSTG